jgi:outer membrane protein assembly factor BamB
LNATKTTQRLPLALLVFSTILSATDWPRFRGPNGSGVDASASELPVEFGPSAGVAWKANVPFGRSSPIVAGGRVFLTATERDRLVTMCFDARSGRLLWRRELKPERTHKVFRANDAASPTPAADEGNVYVFFPDVGLISYTFSGMERWRHLLGPFDNYYGMASSPIVAGDLVILSCDQTKGSYLLALDRANGRQRWKASRPDAGSGWSVPIVHFSQHAQEQLILLGSTRLDSYYLATGERRWWLPVATEGSMGSPVVYSDGLLVYATGHDQPWMETFEAALAKYDRDKDGRVSQEEFRGDKDWYDHFGWIDANRDGFIQAAEWSTARSFGMGDYGILSIQPGSASGQLPAGAIRWRFKRNLPYVPTPVLYNHVYFMVRNGGIVTSLDPATGTLGKQGRTDKALGAYWASPVAADGKVFLLSEEGKLTVLKAVLEWEVLAVNDLGDEAFATPAIRIGRIFVRTRTTLYSFTAKN